MNHSLNESIKESLRPGRVRMNYQHLFERDTFWQLSDYGKSLLPPSIHQRSNKDHGPRLRITTNTKTSAVVARIVKIRIADLHIFDPSSAYDCRIALNLEVNLNRPDIIDADALIKHDEGTGQAMMAEAARTKDRLSYKHLAYSIDLTKVEREGMEKPKFELELEVDSALLRTQMGLWAEGRENAYSDLVAGFLDNATFLMRERVVAPPG